MMAMALALALALVLVLALAMAMAMALVMAMAMVLAMAIAMVLAMALVMTLAMALAIVMALAMALVMALALANMDKIDEHITRLYKTLGYPKPCIKVLDNPTELKASIKDTRIMLTKNKKPFNKIRVWCVEDGKITYTDYASRFTHNLNKINVDLLTKMALYELPNAIYNAFYNKRIYQFLEHNQKIRFLAHNYIGKYISLGWYYENFCFLLKYPKYNSINKSGNIVLHSVDKPVVEYSDGLSLYYLNGVNMPDDLWTIPTDQIDIGHLMLRYKNAEVRKELAKLVGAKRIIESLNAAAIDNWNDYTLYIMNIKGMNTPIHCLRMINPSTNEEHWEYVHPTCKTIQSALSWRIGGLKWNPTQLT